MIQVQATASTGPWFAGSLWSTYPVPCNCVNGFCYSWCYIGSQSVEWDEIPAEAACGPNSVVYQRWSGPLGYCTFPGGVPPPITPSNPPSNATGQDSFGDVPEGTVFNRPSEVPAIQGLIISGCIAVFFAAIAGCVDAGTTSGSFVAALFATFLSLAGFVLTLAAYSLWSDFPYVQGLQSQSPSSIWIPVWISPSQNQMTAVQVASFDYGPGWVTALVASIVVFFCFLVHCVSLANRPVREKRFTPPYGENVTPNPPPTAVPADVTTEVAKV